MANQPFIVALIALLVGVFLARLVTYIEVRHIERDHQSNLQNIRFLHSGEIDALKKEQDRIRLMLVKAAYEAGSKDGSCKCAAK